MKARLWWQDDQPDSDRLIPKADLIAWFKGAAKALQSTKPSGSTRIVTRPQENCPGSSTNG
jgi:hypothetical protein